MPLYEYICKACSQSFEALVVGGKRTECPECGSTRLEQQLSVFAVGARAAKASANSSAAGPCGTCGDPRGPGACELD